MSDRSSVMFSRRFSARWLALPALFALTSAASGGCSGSGDAGLTAVHTCSVNADCGASEECSGNTCVSFVSCASAASCPLGQNCIQQVCRETCTTDAQCAPLKLSCDAASGVCLPAPSASATGGAGGSSGAGVDAGGSSSAGENTTLGGAPATGGSQTTSASAGPGGSGGISGSGGTSAGGAPPLEVTDLIDDLEDGDTSILMNAGRVGQWYFYNPAGSNNAGDIQQSLDSSFPGANGSKFSIETKGGPLSGDSAEAYAGLAFDFDNQGNTPTDPSRMPYDLSAWDGISFWAKGNLPNQSVRFELPTLEVVAPEQHGTCMAGGGCYDSYGKQIALTGEWSKYELPFSTLAQEGWGAAQPLNLSAALGVDFEYDTPSGSFDFAIDDVALYRASAGAGGSSASK